MRKFRKILSDRRGATAIEYGLIAALIAAASLTALQGIGTELGVTYTTLGEKLKSSSNGG